MTRITPAEMQFGRHAHLTTPECRSHRAPQSSPPVDVVVTARSARGRCAIARPTDAPRTRRRSCLGVPTPLHSMISSGLEWRRCRRSERAYPSAIFSREGERGRACCPTRPRSTTTRRGSRCTRFCPSPDDWSGSLDHGVDRAVVRRLMISDLREFRCAPNRPGGGKALASRISRDPRREQ
jgi:hypothetical protein